MMAIDWRMSCVTSLAPTEIRNYLLRYEAQQCQADSIELIFRHFRYLNRSWNAAGIAHRNCLIHDSGTQLWWPASRFSSHFGFDFFDICMWRIEISTSIWNNCMATVAMRIHNHATTNVMRTETRRNKKTEYNIQYQLQSSLSALYLRTHNNLIIINNNVCFNSTPTYYIYTYK